MEAVIKALLTVKDYERADKVILLLMQSQVKSLLDAALVGKRKAKNSRKGISTILSEFLTRPIVGPDCTSNLASLSPFKVEGVYYTQGRFGKQLKRVLGTEKPNILPSTCKLAKLLMDKAHNVAHMSGSNTCSRS